MKWAYRALLDHGWLPDHLPSSSVSGIAFVLFIYIKSFGLLSLQYITYF